MVSLACQLSPRRSLLAEPSVRPESVSTKMVRKEASLVNIDIVPLFFGWNKGACRNALRAADMPRGKGESYGVIINGWEKSISPESSTAVALTRR